jgi:hypothetical protein
MCYSNSRLVNEAYDLIKPHIKHIKSSLNMSSVNIKLSKELTIHFFAESERCKTQIITDLDKLNNQQFKLYFKSK